MMPVPPPLSFHDLVLFVEIMAPASGFVTRAVGWLASV